MPESASGKTFLGDATVRHMLHSLWAALENEETTVVGLVIGLDDLVLKWDEECKRSIASDQAVSMPVVSSNEGTLTHEYPTRNQIFGCATLALPEAASMAMVSGGEGLCEYSAPLGHGREASTISNVVAGVSEYALDRTALDTECSM